MTGWTKVFRFWNGPPVAARRRRYYCMKCQRFHGKAALQKWQKHRAYAAKTEVDE